MTLPHRYHGTLLPTACHGLPLKGGRAMAVQKRPVGVTGHGI